MRNYQSVCFVRFKKTLLSAVTASIVASFIQTTNAAEAIEEIIIFGTQSRLDSVTGSRLNLGILETQPLSMYLMGMPFGPGLILVY